MYQYQESPSYKSFDSSSLQLADMVEPTDKLCRLAKLINWTLLCESFENDFKASKSLSPRMLFALLYLQAKENVSFDELLERWLVTPEWQYFCGETSLKDTYPVRPAVLSVWSRELGVTGSKLMCAALSPSFVEMKVH